MPEALHRDFKEFCQLLIEADVRFLVIGGYAVAWHGRARHTEDFDIWIDSSEDNAKKVVQCLRDFGFDTPQLDESLFTRNHGIVRMGNPPWKIELFVQIPGVEFPECYEGRESWPVGDLSIPIISLSHLRKNKAASGRAKDLADLKDYLPE